MTCSITASVSLEIRFAEISAPHSSFEDGNDLPGHHALGLQKEDLVVHPCEVPLMLFSQLWDKASGGLCGVAQLKLASLRLQGYRAVAVAAVVCIRLLMLL